MCASFVFVESVASCVESVSFVDLRTFTIRFVPPEETLWSKLYVLQRDRCDWPDILNILYSVGPDLDWDRLLARVDEDAPLLAALVEVFRWVCPDRCRELPADARARLETAARSGAPGASERRV